MVSTSRNSIITATPFLLPFITLLVMPCLLAGQCSLEVNHRSGNKLISNTNVSIVTEGKVGYNEVAENSCEGHFLQYQIGKDSLWNQDDGSYTFNFSPPAKAVTLNFFRLDDWINQGAGFEEIQLFVNGEHYPIPERGLQLPCESDSDHAILTSEGNVRADPFSHHGAWEGTTIIDTIHSITVLNKVMGNPNGAFFTLFFCERISTSISTNLAQEYNVYPNPSNDQISVNSQHLTADTKVELYTPNGSLMIPKWQFENGEIKIFRNNLPEGIYYLKLHKHNNIILTKQILFID